MQDSKNDQKNGGRQDINLQDSRGVGYQFPTGLLSLPPKTKQKAKSKVLIPKQKIKSQIHLSYKEPKLSFSTVIR